MRIGRQQLSFPRSLAGMHDACQSAGIGVLGDNGRCGMVIEAAKSVLLVVSALFPIVDPIGGSPIFLSLTRHYTAETRKLLARRIAVNSFVLLVASFTIGSHVLSFFGLSLPVVQVGGGLIVISTGW